MIMPSSMFPSEDNLDNLFQVKNRLFRISTYSRENSEDNGQHSSYSLDVLSNFKIGRLGQYYNGSNCLN